VRNHGGVIISDEVQTAWGRTGGKWFGIEHSGVVPDIITSAKGLGNGAPIGVTVARPEVAAAFPAPTISTFGGNPVSAAAALAVLEFIEENRLLTNVAEVGAYLRSGLEDMALKHPLIGDVRGMGLMQGLELVTDRVAKTPATAETARLLEAARKQRLLIGKGGMYGNVLRITPPMNISRSDVDECLARLDRAFQEIETN
jgi:4-aminobutyrate aminotransferase-like enzyme